MRKSRYLASLALPFAALTAAARAEVPVTLKSAFGSEAERRGDRAALLAGWLDALGNGAGDAGTEALLRRMTELDTYDVEPPRSRAVYEKLLRSGGLSPRVRELVGLRLSRFYRRAGEFGRAESVEASLGYVRKWALAGPFGYTRWSVHERVFPPERKLDFARGMKRGGRSVRWRAWEAPGSGRDADLSLPLPPGKGGCLYAVAQVRFERAGSAVLIVRNRASWKAWWNGSALADANRGRRRERLERAFAVPIRAGWNRLLLKLACMGQATTVRLIDEEGRALEAAEWEDGLVLHPVPKEAAITSFASAHLEAEELDTSSAGALRDLAGKLTRPGEKAAALAGLGLVLLYDLGEEEALEHLERACELSGENPHYSYVFGRACERAMILPPSLRRMRALSAYRKAASVEGGFLPAAERLAHFLNWDKKPEEALFLLKKLMKKSGAGGTGSPWPALLTAEIAAGQGWTGEALASAQEAEKAAPDNARVHLFWARYYRKRRNFPSAVSALKAGLRRDVSDVSTQETVAELLGKMGRHKEALRALRTALQAEPGRLSGYLTLARAELEGGRIDAALATIKAGLRVAPRNPELSRLLGEVHLRAGRPSEAFAAWERALAVRPSWHELRRQLESMRGDEEFWKPYAIDVKEAIGESKGPGDYPRSDEILVVDQTVHRIYEDGSYSEMTHQARKVLTTDGAEELSHVRIYGELLEARTHRPDGTVLEPVVLAGEDRLTMPGVEIGSVIEYKYREEHPAPDGGFVRLPSWYFRSKETTHQLSDYVVIAPKSMKLTVLERNWGKIYPGESFESFPPQENGDTTVYRWISRNARPIYPEALHEHIGAFLPHVEIGVARTWQDVAAELSDVFLGRVRPTEAIGREVRDAIKGARSDEEKARALFRRVTELVRAESRLYEAGQIYLARAGSKTVLLHTFLEEAGLEARFALTRPRRETIPSDEGPGEPDWELPGHEIFRDTLVAVKLGGGRHLWMDPESPYVPFGAIVPRFQGGLAFVLDGPNGILTNLPWGDVSEHGTATRVEMTVCEPTERGGQAAPPEASGLVLQGTFELVIRGAIGSAFKERFAESDRSWRENWAGKRLARAIPGASLEKLSLENLQEPEKPFVLKCSFVDVDFEEVLPDAGEPGSEPSPAAHRRGGLQRLRLPHGFRPLRLVKKFVKSAERTVPLKVTEAVMSTDEIVLRAPNSRGFSVPEPAFIQGPFGSYSLLYDVTGTARSAEAAASAAKAGRKGSLRVPVLRITRCVRLMPQIVDTSRYEEFVEFCGAVDAAERHEVLARYARE